MRIYKRKEFLELPAGTFYAKGKPMYFEELCIKGETLVHNDWYESAFCWVQAKSSEEGIFRMEAMLQADASYPMQDSLCRDGCFEDDAIFLVFEKDDLLKLRGWIDEAIKL